MTLIVGATGLLGSEICRQLAAKGKPVKALVRPTADKDKVRKLKELGTLEVQGDLKDRSSLDAACQGVRTIISTASSTFSRQPGDSIESVDRDGQLNLVDAAKAAGVRHFILISFPEILDLDFPLQSAKRAVEQKLKKSGLVFTILQPTFFTEVWLSAAIGFDFANGKARLYGSGKNKISWISYADVAQFAVACLDNATARNAVIKLGGPQALSPLETVRIFEQAGGKKIAVEFVPEEALQTQKANAPDPLQESFAALMLYYARGDAIDMRETLKKFPVRLTSVPEYAKRVLGAP